MPEKIKRQSKRGGPRKGAGRKSKAQKTDALVAAGVLSEPEPEAKEQAKIGRPTEYKPEYVAQAEKLCRLGATDRELADFFEVTTVTIWRWAHKYDAFCNALRAGKGASDDRVERSLYNRAVGYSFESVKIFMPAGADAPVYAPYTEHVPPDVAAASKWLSSRRPEAWRERNEGDEALKEGLAALLQEGRKRANQAEAQSVH